LYQVHHCMSVTLGLLSPVVVFPPLCLPLSVLFCRYPRPGAVHLQNPVHLHYDDNCNLYSNLLKVDTCPKCEEGWELHGGKCYYFSTTKSTWNQSRDDCRSKGGDLVKIDSREEQSFLELRLRQKMDSDYDKFWIGLTDSKEEDKWLWVDDSPLNTSLTFWIRGEPDNWNGRNGEVPEGEDCAAMGKKSGAADLKCWFDIFCKKNYKSICEKSPGLSLDC
uniref:C-type lectin domain-containing protein n=1 Tax=Anabas testudineus TaxID=64144 RepID=A0A3Q1H4J3_ANATE